MRAPPANYSKSQPGVAPLPTSVARASLGDRVIAGVFASVLLGVLATAAWLNPSPDGHGTHTQLGLPRCGWYSVTGHPCPTCGMTTSFALMAHGRALSAIVTQPMGAMLAMAASIGFWGCMHVAIFGSRLGSMALRLLTPLTMWVTGAIGLGAWIYKMMVG